MNEKKLNNSIRPLSFFLFLNLFLVNSLYGGPEDTVGAGRYSYGGDESTGYIVFFAFWAIIIVLALISSSKDSVKEKKEFKKKESYKKEVGPDKYREEMAERFWAEKCYSERISLNEVFNYKDLEENNWTYYDFCIDCSYFGEIAQYGTYKVQAKPHFEVWLANQDKKYSKKISEKVVSSCPRCPPNHFQYHVSPTGKHTSDRILCNSNEEKPFGLPEEVQGHVRHVFVIHSEYLEERRESVFLTPEQSDKLTKIKELGVEDLRIDQILQGEEPAENPYVDEPLKDLSHPFSKFCVRNLSYGRFYPFYSVKEYRENEDLQIGYAEEIFEKDISTNFKYQLDYTGRNEHGLRIEVNYFTFNYKSFKKIKTENPYDAYKQKGGYGYGNDVFFPELDSLMSIKVQDDFSEEQEKQQKKIAKTYLDPTKFL